ncbi:MAG: succinate dehydrogenase assembly factor 2 [Porticoccaceae bacterium]|jgi:antitoxin CptB
MEKNRLMWASRRGMLELDLMLQPFVEKHYDQLDQTDQQLFQELLELEDQQLFLWLVRGEQTTNINTQRIVDIICESRKRSQ